MEREYRRPRLVIEEVRRNINFSIQQESDVI